MANLYSGDIPSNFSVADGQSVRANVGASGFDSVDLRWRAFTQVFPSPVNNGACMMRFAQAVTLTDVYGTATGGGSMNLQLNKRTNPSTSGTNMLSSALGISGAACYTNSFANSSFAADDWLYVDLSSKSGTVNYLTITIMVRV